MIIILNNGQKNQLVGNKFDGVQYFNPVSIGNNRWAVSSEEVDQLTSPTFNWLKAIVKKGKGAFVLNDLEDIQFTEDGQTLTLFRKDGLIKSFNYVSLPNKPIFDTLKNHILTNYGTYTSVHFIRKHGVVNIINNLSSIILAIEAMDNAEKSIFEAVGQDCLILINS